MHVSLKSALLLTCPCFLTMALFGAGNMTAAERESKRVVSIPARQGKLEWRDILREVSRQSGVEVDVPLPAEGEIDLHSRATRWTILGLNLAMRGDVHLRVDRKNDRLIVTVDTESLAKKREKYGRGLRELRDSKESDELLGLQLNQTPRTIERADRLVVLVHGFSSSPAALAALQQRLEDDGHMMASFGYRSSHGVVEAAETLRRDLVQLMDQLPETKITIVAHSMGGLVSRWVVEHTQTCPDNIDQLILLATPNHGSDLTRPGLSGPTIHVKNVRVNPVRIGELAGGVAEGLNLAIRDLRPGSTVLQRLHDLPRNPAVSYAIILGDSSIVDPVLLSLSQQLLVQWQNNPIAFTVVQQLASFEGQMDELLSGRGDGVVSLASGRLDGVSDVTILPMRHSDVGREHKPVFQEIQREVRRRLAVSG
jgi:pimeloyl-ACP methyl ester carboxylesterase